MGTVSRESAPRAANFESPETAESAGRASCFFTISHTFFTVSGLACIGALAVLLLVYIIIRTLSLKYKWTNVIILKHKVLLYKTNVPIHNTDTKQLIKWQWQVKQPLSYVDCNQWTWFFFEEVNGRRNHGGWTTIMCMTKFTYLGEVRPNAKALVRLTLLRSGSYLTNKCWKSNHNASEKWLLRGQYFGRFWNFIDWRNYRARNTKACWLQPKRCEAFPINRKGNWSQIRDPAARYLLRHQPQEPN